MSASVDARVICDTCVHRVAMPGSVDKLGALQVSHHHPDEPHSAGEHGG